MRRLIPLLIVAMLAGSAVRAGAQLRLIDGQVIDGTGVERRAEIYVLDLEDGDRLTIPAELVAEVVLTGDDDPAVTGLVEAEGKTLVGPPDDVRLPNPAEQLQALGRPPAAFPRNVIDPYWQPKSDWDMSPEVNNNWNPVRWATSPIDWNWNPRSVFRKSDDVTEFSPVRWATSPIAYTWWPSDGF